MKKSGHVALTIVAAVGLAGCGRRGYDPCSAATFNEFACQQAVQQGGYYYNGTWYSMRYDHPYPYYYDSYHTYVSHGGSVYSHGGSYSSPSSSVERGGFGSHGASGSHGGSGSGE
jgi:hypothetical protein